MASLIPEDAAAKKLASALNVLDFNPNMFVSCVLHHFNTALSQRFYHVIIAWIRHWAEAYEDDTIHPDDPTMQAIGEECHQMMEGLDRLDDLG